MAKMFTASEQLKKEYACEIVRIGKIQPIEGSDFLAKTEIHPNMPIVVRKDEVFEGAIMFYVDMESQINHNFLSSNNLFSDSEYNKDPNEKGFFNKNGRVRMVRLRGQESMGFLFGLDAVKKYCPKLSRMKTEDLEVGLVFDTIDDELFVQAYVPPMPQQPQRADKAGKRNKKLKKFDRMIPGEFSFHYDTDQLEKNIHRFTPEDNIVISLKLHGCVEKNTLVNTREYGNITIGEIVSKKLDCHILAHDNQTNEDVYVPIDNYYLKENDGEWYEIELEDGTKLLVTGNNPIWLPTLNTYRRVDELTGDEYVLKCD